MNTDAEQERLIIAMDQLVRQLCDHGDAIIKVGVALMTLGRDLVAESDLRPGDTAVTKLPSVLEAGRDVVRLAATGDLEKLKAAGSKLADAIAALRGN